MASTNIDLLVDETYLLALINNDESLLLPFSDEEYAYELSVQEALYSASSSPLSTNTPEPSYSYNFQTSPKIVEIKRELGESSQSKQMLCGICMESKQDLEIFSGLSYKCNHAFCIDCVTEYLASKIKENIAKIECPDPNCNQSIEPENCNNILPKEVFGRWEDGRCEAMILSSQNFYCPYNECSALMVNDAQEEVTKFECPSCRRLFCAQCLVRWHAGVTCEEFQRLGEDERGSDDLMVMTLAKDKEWRRCSSCSFYVERNDGCLHMTCRCRYEFCYRCGSKWSSEHHC